MNVSSPSWEAMYADDKFSWFWPPAYDPKSSPPELKSILSLLEPQAGERLLDLACGQGWLTIPLALHGLQVTGFDLSAKLLARGKDAAEQANIEIEWIRGDMRNLPSEWSQTFDFVTFTLSEFGCFSNQSDNQSVLEEVARVLKSGGRYLLDIVVNRDGLVHHGKTRNCLEGDGFFVFEKGSLDLLSGIHKRVFRWYYLGQLYKRGWQIQTYTPREVKYMLEQARFQILAVYSNLTGDKLSRNSNGMTFLSQK